MKQVIIGSRGSDLALWQAHFVKDELEKLNCAVQIKIIKTQGDRIQHLSFDKLEGKGFFTKELEEELLMGTIDLAVHSHKDLETTQPEGLCIAAVSERANPSDIIIISRNSFDPKEKWGLKQDARIGTSSARRKVQLSFHRPDLKISDLRGNVPTRIEKLASGQYDAIMLAKAGVDRLKIDLQAFEVIVMNPAEFVPAPAQGVLGLQIRVDDKELEAILAKLNSPTVARQIALERKVLNLMQGGCQLPLGVYCTDELVHVAYASDVNSPLYYLHDQVDGLPDQAERLVASLKVLA